MIFTLAREGEEEVIERKTEAISQVYPSSFMFLSKSDADRLHSSTAFIAEYIALMTGTREEGYASDAATPGGGSSASMPGVLLLDVM